jgi:hypothetical protein
MNVAEGSDEDAPAAKFFLQSTLENTDPNVRKKVYGVI